MRKQMTADAYKMVEDMERLEDEMWERNQDAGMMRVGFTGQGKRRSTYLTNFWSRFTGCHKEEAISRLGTPARLCSRESKVSRRQIEPDATE